MKYRVTAEGVLETGLAGFDLINFPMLNKGTAFTEKERTDFALHGLLPPHVGNLEDQATRRLKVLRDFETGFERYAYLRDLQDTNETLFYSLLVRNIEEMMPLVYTPTVGEGCQRFSEIWRKPADCFSVIQTSIGFAKSSRIRAMTRFARSWSATASVFWDSATGCRRHGNPNRQTLALYGLRRHSPTNVFAGPARRGHRQCGSAGRSPLYRMASSTGARGRI